VGATTTQVHDKLWNWASDIDEGTLSYAAPQLPPSFTIMLIATAAYGASYLASAVQRGRRQVATQASGSAESVLSGVDR
jgi:hypothetical protein